MPVLLSPPSSRSASRPMAVLLLIFSELSPSALEPTAVLLLPIVLSKSVESPTAVLLLPVVLNSSANAPIAVFTIPPVFEVGALSPRNVLSLLVSQPSRQTARACDASVMYVAANASGMKRKPRRRNQRQPKFLIE